MPQQDDDSLEIYWDAVDVAQARQPLPNEPEPVPNFRDQVQSGDLAIGTSRDRVLVIIRPNGELVYGPEYRPDEAAMAFWEAMGVRRLMMEDRLLVIQHMEAVLVRLGVADMESERLRRAVQDEDGEDPEAVMNRVREADQAVRRLEQVATQAIELGRALARRSEVSVPAMPAQVPASVQQNPNSEYQGREGLPPEPEVLEETPELLRWPDRS